MASQVLLDALNSTNNLTGWKSPEEILAPLLRSLDDFFLVVLAIITFGLQMGFLFVEVALVRRKNVSSTLFKATLDSCIGCMVFWLVGYAFAWSDGNSVIGWHNFAFVDLPKDKYAYALYQMIFANTASTIINGALSERMHLPCYFTYGILQTGIAYPILSRWGWNKSGWLKAMGYRDFSGSGIIHVYAGACGFVAAWIVGPRTNRYHPTRQDDSMPPHSMPLLSLGVVFLMFGFAGFNAASQSSISQPGDGFVVANSVLTTFLAYSGGGISAVFMTRFMPHFGGKWSYLHMGNGALGGVVAVCAGCDSLAPWAAFVTGVLAGVAYVFGRCLVDRLKVDDLVDSFALHYSTGLVGLMSAPFLIADGIIYKQDMASAMVLGMNLLGVLTITVWAFLWNLPLLLLLKHFGVLRVDEEMETSGLDAMEHSEEAYPSADWGERPPDAVTNMDQPNKAESVSPASGRGIRTDQHLSNDMILIKRQKETSTHFRQTIGRPEKALFPSRPVYISSSEFNPAVDRPSLKFREPDDDQS